MRWFVPCYFSIKLTATWCLKESLQNCLQMILPKKQKFGEQANKNQRKDSSWAVHSLFRMVWGAWEEFLGVSSRKTWWLPRNILVQCQNTEMWIVQGEEPQGHQIFIEQSTERERVEIWHHKQEFSIHKKPESFWRCQKRAEERRKRICESQTRNSTQR